MSCVRYIKQITKDFGLPSLNDKLKTYIIYTHTYIYIYIEKWTRKHRLVVDVAILNLFYPWDWAMI
jgi:hypothetical protein